MIRLRDASVRAVEPSTAAHLEPVERPRAQAEPLERVERPSPEERLAQADRMDSWEDLVGGLLVLVGALAVLVEGLVVAAAEAVPLMETADMTQPQRAQSVRRLITATSRVAH